MRRGARRRPRLLQTKNEEEKYCGEDNKLKELTTRMRRRNCG